VLLPTRALLCLIKHDEDDRNDDYAVTKMSSLQAGKKDEKGSIMEP
jgi:hypothetical protein